MARQVHAEAEERKAVEALRELEASLDAAATARMIAEGDVDVLQKKMVDVQRELRETRAAEEMLREERRVLVERAS